MSKSEQNPWRSGHKADIGHLLDRLRDNYPTLFVASEEDWRRKCTAYWKKIKGFDLEIIDAACDRAPEKYPDRLPTVGQLWGICVDVENERKRVARERHEESERRRQERETRAEVDDLRDHVIPNDEAGQQAWVRAGSGLMEKLARHWECESKNMGLDPNEPTPPDVYARRLRQFWKVWERMDQESKPTYQRSLPPPPDPTEGKEEPGL